MTMWKKEKLSHMENISSSLVFTLVRHCFHEIFVKKVCERISRFATLCKRPFGPKTSTKLKLRHVTHPKKGNQALVE